MVMMRVSDRYGLRAILLLFSEVISAGPPGLAAAAARARPPARDGLSTVTPSHHQGSYPGLKIEVCLGLVPFTPKHIRSIMHTSARDRGPHGHTVGRACMRGRAREWRAPYGAMKISSGVMLAYLYERIH